MIYSTGIPYWQMPIFLGLTLFVYLDRAY